MTVSWGLKIRTMKKLEIKESFISTVLGRLTSGFWERPYREMALQCVVIMMMCYNACKLSWAVCLEKQKCMQCNHKLTWWLTVEMTDVTVTITSAAVEIHLSHNMNNPRIAFHNFRLTAEWLKKCHWVSWSWSDYRNEREQPQFWQCPIRKEIPPPPFRPPSNTQ